MPYNYANYGKPVYPNYLPQSQTFSEYSTYQDQASVPSEHPSDN